MHGGALPLGALLPPRRRRLYTQQPSRVPLLASALPLPLLRALGLLPAAPT